MDTETKLFSHHLRQIYPKISLRILDDLAERTLISARKNVPNELRLPDLLDILDDEISSAIDLSPAVERAMRDSQYEGDCANEVIVIYKSSEVSTSLQFLAEQLRDGIRRVTKDLHPKHKVIVTAVADVVTDKPTYGEGHRIQIVPVPREGRLIRDYLDGHPHWRDINPHRVVYVGLPDSPRQELPHLKSVLPGALVEDDQYHFSSFIPTILAPKPDRRVVNIETLEFDEHFSQPHYRLHRDSSVLSADDNDPTSIPIIPKQTEIDRWARNVTNRQVGFATSGGGASAFRIIALLKPLMKELPVDVFAGLSGGALVGAYFTAKGVDGLDQLIEMGNRFARIMPLMSLSTKFIEQEVDRDLNYQQVGLTSINFYPTTTELLVNEPPVRQIIIKATLGQAVRASGALPGLFAPTFIKGRLFTDGMASAIIPTEVVVDHGGDTVMAVNCIPGPDRTNPYSDNALGRLAYKTGLGRYIDSWTWVNFLTQNASSAYGKGSDVYYEFGAQNISSLEPNQWRKIKSIYEDAMREQPKIDEHIAKLKSVWESKQ